MYRYHWSKKNGRCGLFLVFKKHLPWPLEPWLNLIESLNYLFYRSKYKQIQRMESLADFGPQPGVKLQYYFKRWGKKKTSLNWFHDLHWQIILLGKEEGNKRGKMMYIKYFSVVLKKTFKILEWIKMYLGCGNFS